MYKSIKETAEKILGRSLRIEDGLPIEAIEKVEKRLQLMLPKILREFYQNVGSLTLMTNSIEHFIPLEKLRSVDNRLIFAEVEDGCCYWGINLNERYNKDAKVYMCVDEHDREQRIWFSENIGITDFIHTTMYYKCVQALHDYSHYLGNYYFTGSIDLDNGREEIDRLVEKLDSEWEKVAVRTTFTVYWRNRQVVWFFTTPEGLPDEMVMLASQTDESYIELLKEFGFYKGSNNE